MFKQIKELDPALFNALRQGELDLESVPKGMKEQLREILVGALTKKASTDFLTYVELMAPEILPEGFINGRHIKLIAKDLQEVEQSIVETRHKQQVLKEKKARSKRSQYFLPPGGMKSKLISILFVTWFMGRHPEWPVMQLGHSTKFCIDNFGRQVLEVLFSDKFKAIFPNPACRVKRTARSAQSFQLVGGGKYYTTGAGSKIAGRRAALLISDDVVSEQDAYSDNMRNKINEWYVGGARSRMLPFGTEVIVNTRWNTDDLSGYLENLDKDSSNPWNIIRFPAILDANGAKLLGLKVGDSFWPELWPVETFIELQRIMAPSKFNAMYQQNPIPDDGNIIKEEFWQEWDEDKEGDDTPWCEAVIASFDTAFSEKTTADYSAYTIWGVFFKREKGRNGFEYIAANLFLLGSEKGRWGFPTLLEKVEQVKEAFDPDYYLIENKASGQSLIQELRLKQYPIVEFDPGRDDKIMRMNACVPTFLARKVWYPKGKAWAKEVIGEVCQFPNGSSKDIPDTVSQAILWMRKGLIVPSEGEFGYEDQREDQPNEVRRNNTYWSAVSSNR